MDFLIVSKKILKNGIIEIYPKFIIKNDSKDLMIRGGDFYAIWVESLGMWSKNEQDAIRLIDYELDSYVENHKEELSSGYKVLHLWDAESGMIDAWHKYCQKQLRDHYHSLDEKLVFINDPVKKEDYSSKKLPYALADGDISSYNELISTLYSEEERHKLEWAIGSIITGASKDIQKFVVLYGAAGTGKSTVLNIIQKLFDGYYSVFDARALGSSNNVFALEAFKSNPLVAIQHDGDLSRIEDNTKLNSLVSHEYMTVNEKFKSTYTNKFISFLFMGTNKPVKITDAKSGLIRRLIDVTPTGNKLSPKKYRLLMNKIEFEYGAIAWHCREVYLSNPDYYDRYVPLSMMSASNDFYNYVSDSYFTFKEENGISLKSAWELYKTYCSDTNIPYPMTQRVFKEELKNYFSEYYDRYSLEDGTRVRSYYFGFKTDIFDSEVEKAETKDTKTKYLIKLDSNESVFDKEYSSCFAQYANSKGTPTKSWDSVSTTLKDIDTSKTHYVKVNESQIIIDFDERDEKGNKSLEKNILEASKWPPTYAEVSNSGNGIHLHYIYTGDPNRLSRIFAENIEVKVFTGKSSLRRKLTKCNNLPIATITSGLPLKGEKMINTKSVKNEKMLRTLIKRNLAKEIHAFTKPSIDFIYQLLEDAYNSGMHYDVSDLHNAVFAFAMHSSNQSEYCMHLVPKMHFKSEDASEPEEYSNDSELAFFDLEVFSNLLVCCWKFKGKDKKVVRMINPKPAEIELLIKMKLVGFNNRKYDNHILYARLMGYTNKQLYDLSQRIINKERDAFFGEAYNLSYTDIYDFASAGNKKSLKKLEIEMGIHHQELGLPWDKPVPEDMFDVVADYCCNDVIATEAAFDYLSADWTARQILADISGMTVNDTTNSMSAKFIFGNNKNPQSEFNYRNMGDTSVHLNKTVVSDEGIVYPEVDEYTVFDDLGRPVFPGYSYSYGKSLYRGEDPKEGGYVYAEPGIYVNVALLDIASMHPSSIIAEKLFGEEFTKRFEEVKQMRVEIKHRNFEKAKKMLNGALAKYLDDESMADALADALKTIINSIYGLTSAHFSNPFKDPRNVDNIVAKRGALFMINLKHAVQERGYTVAHIKTDSIKIPNADDSIIEFIMDYGKRYGYTFEHEATYDRMCLINDAVYIAKYDDKGVRNKGGKHANEWSATGAQFAVPYVFKTLFSKDAIEFDDMCETKSVTSALYLDMNEKLPDVSEKEAMLEKIKKKYPEMFNPDTPKSKEVHDILEEISSGHDYHFVGRVGQFCPIKSGCGGGILCREAKDPKTDETKYVSATGAKGYRWLESELVKNCGKQKDIDRGYYNALVDDAVNVISSYGDFEMFVSNEPYISVDFPPDDDKPPF